MLGVCHGEQGMQIRLDALTRAARSSSRPGGLMAPAPPPCMYLFCSGIQGVWRPYTERAISHASGCQGYIHTRCLRSPRHSHSLSPHPFIIHNRARVKRGTIARPTPARSLQSRLFSPTRAYIHAASGLIQMYPRTPHGP